MQKKRPHKEAKDTAYNVFHEETVAPLRSWTFRPPACHAALCVVWTGLKDEYLCILHLPSGKFVVSAVKDRKGTAEQNVPACSETLEAMCELAVKISGLTDWSADGPTIAKALGSLDEIKSLSASIVGSLLPLRVPAAEKPRGFILEID